jgi:hypothetical protein
MECRDYDRTKDKEAVHRIWRETGWLEKGKEEAVDFLIECGRAKVAVLHGAPESLAITAPGTIRYLNEDLSFSCVTGVTTSRIARKLGLAKRVTASIIAEDAKDGALVSGLGMFEQGYYNQLGYGTGGYEYHTAFDPSQLNVEVKARVPRRFSPNDWKMVHHARLNRVRGHGSCNLTPSGFTRSMMLRTQNGFGLGYGEEPTGDLTHYLWCGVKNVEQGPYRVEWMVFRTRDQFHELMALLKSLSDQIRLVRMREPQSIQIQDLLNKPIKQLVMSEKSGFESRVLALAWWQMRICDLPGCLERTHLPWGDVRFNLKLADPIENVLGDKAPWRGIAGTYVITLGPSSGAEPGMDNTLPTLEASVGPFTRMWLGVRPATGLAVTDELTGPQELLEKLDCVLCLPDPKPDWDF